MRKLLMAFILVSLFLSFSSAHDSYYDYKYRPEVIYVDEPTYIVLGDVDSSYGNEKRYSLYDYRHGYSYRATREFKEDYLRSEIIRLNKRERYEDYQGHNTYSARQIADAIYLNERRDYGAIHLEEVRKEGISSSYYTYNSIWDKYYEHDCYIEPPRNKIFYRKCP